MLDAPSWLVVIKKDLTSGEVKKESVTVGDAVELAPPLIRNDGGR